MEYLINKYYNLLEELHEIQLDKMNFIKSDDKEVYSHDNEDYYSKGEYIKYIYDSQINGISSQLRDIESRLI